MSPVWVAFICGAFLGSWVGFFACAILSIGPRQDAIARAEQAGRLAERRERKMGRRVG